MTSHRKPRVPFVGLDQVRWLLRCRPFDEPGWLNILSPDCHVRIGNAAPAIGRDRGITAIAALLSATRSVGDTFWDACREGIALYIECELEFGSGGGRLHLLPCCIVFRPVDRPFQDVRFYCDTTPLPMSAIAT